jgi:HEAT repeat protein
MRNTEFVETRRTHRYGQTIPDLRRGFWIPAIVFVLALGCGTREDPTLNLVARALKTGNVAEAKARLAKAARYPDDLVDALKQALDTNESNWQSSLPAILDATRKSTTAIQSLESRALTEELDDISQRRLTAISGQRDQTFALVATVLAKQDGNSLSASLDAVVDSALIAQLSSNPTVRANVDAIFATLGERAAGPLTKRLTDDDALIRAGAVRYLGRIGTSAVVSALRSRIGVEDDFVALYELPLALGRVRAPESVEALVDILRLKDDGSYVVASAQARAEAVEQLRLALLRLPTMIPAAQDVLLTRLADDNPYVVQRAIAALTAIAQVPATETASVAPANVPVAQSALNMLRSGWQTLPLPVVAQVDADREKARRVAVVTQTLNLLVALREPTTMNEAQRAELLTLIDGYLDNTDLRASANTALTQLGGYALPVLLARLAHTDVAIRVLAGRAIGTINDLRAVPALIERLRVEPDAEALVAVFGAIETMRARDAIPAMVEVIASERGKDSRVQNAAITALARVADATTYPSEMAAASTYMRQLVVSRGTRESVRNNAIVALGKIKPAGVALDLRNVLLDEREPDLIRKNAAWALGEIGAQEAVAAMEEILRIRREEQADFLRRLKSLYKNEATLNARWKELGWQAGYRNFREVKPIPSLVRSEIAHAYRKLKGADAAPLLRDVLLDDQNATVRQAAAFSLGELHKETEALVKALRKDDVGAVRAEAATALGKIKTEAVVEPLLETFRKDDYETTRVNAAVGLREAKYEPAVTGLARVLEEKHRKKDEPESAGVRAEVVIALWKDGVMVAKAMSDVLGNASATVRGDAVDILGIVGATDATDSLIERLKDESPTVRVKAAVALGRLKQRRAVAPLLERATDDKEYYRVRVAATNALASLRDLSTREPLRTLLDSPHPGLRASAIMALGAMKTMDATGRIAAFALDRTEPDAVRTAAIEALGTLGGDTANATLAALLAREVGDLRVAVVAATGAAKTVAVVPSLIAALANRGETDALRRAVASALSGIGDERAGIPLAERLMDPTERTIGFVGLEEHNLFWETASYAARSFRMPAALLPVLDKRLNDGWESVYVRRRVVHALGAIGTPESRAVLLKAAEHSDNEVALYAIRAMGPSKSPELVPKLLDLLANAPTIERKREVPNALGEIGDRRAVDALAKTLAAEGDEALRNNCATALGKLGATAPLASQLSVATTSVGTKVSCLNALGALKAAASSALPAIDALRNDEHADIAFAALAARSAITGEPLGKS